ncbi:MAG: phosphoribosyltransferase [archaeon]
MELQVRTFPTDKEEDGAVISKIEYSDYYPKISIQGLSPKYYYDKKHNETYSLKIIEGKRQDKSSFFKKEVILTINKFEQKMRFKECNLITLIPTNKIELPLSPTMQSIAEILSKELNVPYIQIIKRAIFKKRSGYLVKERYMDVKGSMIVTDSVKNMKILLLDDVRASGISMMECANTLIKSGAKEIIGFSLGTHTSNIPVK